jgi:carbonic anhydrase/SulP family sulfate permease
MSFFQPDRENTFSELLKIVGDLHPGAMVVGLGSLVLLWIWNRWKLTRASGIPAPLVVVAFGIACVAGFDPLGQPWMIEASHRVQLPVAETIGGLLGFLHTPDFAQVGNPGVYWAAVTIALVASLQALLTTEAVDRLDTRRRTTPANRELVAQGVGNCVSGLLGGLPLTCEIVRSSVNVDAGARTKRAAIVHGLLLLAALALFPRAINQIPLACLAAILITTGLRLASPAVFREMRRAGRYQLVPYLITLVAIVFTDPLQGILIGLVVSLGFILWSNQRRPMRLVVEHHLAGDVTRVELANQVSFLNRAELRRVLDGMPRGRHVLLDASESVYIDPDILETVREYRDSIAPARGVHVSTKGFRPKYEIADVINFVDFSSRELQQDLTPERVLAYLRAGNERFRTGTQLKRDLGRQMVATAVGQHPVAVVLSCIDSRSPAEILFDMGLGDIFSVRVAGNVATDEVLGSMEFACAVAGAKLVVVLGHTRCGAVNAAVQVACHPEVPVAPECVHLAPIMESIGKSVDAASCRLVADAAKEGFQNVADDVAAKNVGRVVAEIRRRSGVLDRLIREGRVGIVGMVYDVGSGTTRIVPDTLAGLPADAAMPA